VPPAGGLAEYDRSEMMDVPIGRTSTSIEVRTAEVRSLDGTTRFMPRPGSIVWSDALTSTEAPNLRLNAEPSAMVVRPTRVLPLATTTLADRLLSARS
jgi:hypothetical protein